MNLQKGGRVKLSSIFDQLGFTNANFGDVQSVDEMTIIPICGEDRTKEIAKPSDLKFKRTTTYGSMQFENTNPDYSTVVPSDTMIISEHSAQDHSSGG